MPRPTGGSISLDGSIIAPAPAFVGKVVSLRPIDPGDYPTLLKWRTQLQDLRIWSTSRHIPTLEQFAIEIVPLLRQSIILLAVSAEDAEPVGFIQAYNINQTDGWCFLAAYFAAGFRRQRYGAETFLPFVDYLFRDLNLRKIYMDMQEFNMDFYEIAVKSGAFVEEGRFAQHMWHDGRYWDMIRLALYRETWEQFRAWAWQMLHDERTGTEIIAERRVSTNARQDGGSAAGARQDDWQMSQVGHRPSGTI